MNTIFDKYTLWARLAPALILLSPIVILIYQYFPSGNSELNTYLSMPGYFVFSIFGTHYVRDRGKKIEIRLFQDWGGKPTTLMLRESTVFNSLQLENIHEKLIKISGYKEEKPYNDDVLDFWTKVAIKETRDNKLVLEENISYGFRRNLRAIKCEGILLNIITTVVLLYSNRHLFLSSMSSDNFEWVNLAWSSFPIISKLCVLFNVIMVLSFILIVTKKWVRRAADLYGQRLFESI